MVVGSNPTNSVQLSIATSENPSVVNTEGFTTGSFLQYILSYIYPIYRKYISDIYNPSVNHFLYIYEYAYILYIYIYIYVLCIYIYIYILNILYILYIYIYSYILPRVYLAIWIVWFFSIYEDVISNSLCGSDHFQMFPLKSSSQFRFGSRKKFKA